RQLEEHWRERLRNAEEKNANLAQITSEQFNQAAENVEAKFMKERFVPICEKLQQAVLDCYQANPKQVLKCSEEVKAFNACVQHTQNSILTRKEMSPST
ncbi:MICOS complex subunit Mic19-like, partial [Anneissia japonica]